MDSLQGLRVFCAVVEGGSFAGAAAKLKLSRAMVSKHVMQLEDRLQTRLINRTTRSLSLTEAGAAFHERAVQILADLEAAEQSARSSTSEPRGTLRVNAPTSFATFHVATYIAEFLALYPELNIDISLSDRYVDPIEEGYDLTIRITAKLPESSLIARPLAPCRMVVCGSPAYFSAHGDPKTPDDLARHNCLSYSMSAMEDRWDFVSPRGRRYVVRVGGRVRSNSGDLLRAAIVGGSGIMLIPTFIVGEDLKSGRLKAVLTEYQTTARTIYAVYPSRKHLSAKVRALVEFLEKKYGPTPYWDDWLEAYAPSAAGAK
ncbi:MAG: LysR family transcriptional regulator [Betaproteobacteria bacterium]|nr:LysR family transcriptional regulator [Betaproteobacteria bacterium]MBI2959703.1 LysR family transcriptional regulator [Betaproteobacteria bacterium]